MIDGPLAPLGSTPELFPFNLDIGADSWEFIRLTRADFDAASFLDQRVMAPGMQRLSLQSPQVTGWVDAAHLTESCHFIFHIGHVGSTLLSRLIGAQAQTLSLREPLVLRTLAQIDANTEQRSAVVLKLLSRTFPEQNHVVVKATSFVSEAAHAILERASAPRALMMYVSAESYLATILGGPNSRQEAGLLTPQRLQRLHRRLGREIWAPDSLTEGEAVALGWACETAALAHAANRAGDRVRKIDFDRFLAQPAAHLSAALRHLGIEAPFSEINAILSGPLMHRYSKAPEYAYDAALRDAVLNEARAAHRGEIRRGLRWLERAAEFEAVRDALVFGTGGAP
jgi:hypothetical protein